MILDDTSNTSNMVTYRVRQVCIEDPWNQMKDQFFKSVTKEENNNRDQKETGRKHNSFTSNIIKSCICKLPTQ